MPWVPPTGATEDFYAALPFPESQVALFAPPLTGTQRLVTCGWHGTFLDPDRGAFAVVRTDGPLADLVGERLRVRAGARSVYVYVTAERDIEDDLSLARRAFAALALLSTDRLTVTAEVVA